MPFITLLIADDHNLIRSGLCALLKMESDFRIVGEAASGREAINLAKTLSPDVVIMDSRSSHQAIVLPAHKSGS